jgi:DNA-directed RNA polymerase specialized sigma24 family protein
MTQTHGPLHELTAHLGVLARGPGATRLVHRLGTAGLGIDAGADLMAELDGHAESDRADTALVECLARWAPSDEVASVALLHLLRPRLESMAARLTRHAQVTAGDAESEVLSAAWEVLTRRPPPGRLERSEAIWTEVRRAGGLRRKDRTVSLPEGFDPATPEEVLGSERWPELLDIAGSAGVLRPDEAALILRTRIEGEPLRQVARDLGRPYDALRMERRRAEAALRAYVSSGASS